MDVLFKFALHIAIVMIIYSIVDVLVDGNKTSKYVKNALALVVVIIFLSSIFNITAGNIEFEIEKYNVDNSEVWKNVLDTVSNELENHIISLCAKNGLRIDMCTVALHNEESEILIEKIYIDGRDKIQAKNLISGYLNLNSEYIDINGALQND